MGWGRVVPSYGCDQLFHRTAASALPVKKRWGKDIFNFLTLREKLFLRAKVHLQICSRVQSKKFHISKGLQKRIVLYPFNLVVLGFCCCFLSCNRVLVEAKFSLFFLSSLFLLSRRGLVLPRKVMVGAHRITLIVPQAAGCSPEHGIAKLFWDLTPEVHLCFHISPVTMCTRKVFPTRSSDAVFLMPLHPFSSSLPSYSLFLLDLSAQDVYTISV